MRTHGLPLVPHGRPTLRLWVGMGLLMSPLAWTSAAPPPSPADLQRVDGGVQAEAQRRLDTLLPKRLGGKTVIRADMPRAETALSDLRLSVQGFSIENHPGISSQAIDEVLAPWKGRELSFPEFEEAVHAVAEYLRRNGHPEAEVKVSRTGIGQGSVAVAVQGLSTGRPVAATLAVREFDVQGVTGASPEELRATLAPWADRELSVPDMQAAAQAVASLLRNKGYLLAQAFLPPQRIDTGVIRITVQEGLIDGSLGRNGVTVQTAGQRVEPQVLETILERAVTPGQPVQAQPLERALRVASDLPGIQSVKAVMQPGSQPGTTHLVAQVEEGRLFSGSLWADNHGNRYSGQERLNAILNFNSPFGLGDQFSINATTSSGLDSIKLAASVPISSMGTRMGVSWSGMGVDIGKEFRPLSLNSYTRIVSLFGSHPLARGPELNAWLSVNWDDKHVSNELLDTNLNDRRLSVGTIALNGDWRDAWQGQTAWSLAWSGGELDNQGQVPSADGHFTKLFWSAARLAPLPWGRDWSWYVSLSGQHANRNLDSIEKFQLGGPTGVRAYPTGEGLGDNGLLGTLELRRHIVHTPYGQLGAFGFYDAGRITQFTKLQAGDALFGPNSYTLKGWGLGLSLTHSNNNQIRVVFARKSGQNPNPTATGTDNDGSKRSGRIWIFANIHF